MEFSLRNLWFVHCREILSFVNLRSYLYRINSEWGEILFMIYMLCNFRKPPQMYGTISETWQILFMICGTSNPDVWNYFWDWRNFIYDYTGMYRCHLWCLSLVLPSWCNYLVNVSFHQLLYGPSFWNSVQ